MGLNIGQNSRDTLPNVTNSDYDFQELPEVCGCSAEDRHQQPADPAVPDSAAGGAGHLQRADHEAGGPRDQPPAVPGLPPGSLPPPLP